MKTGEIVSVTFDPENRKMIWKKPNVFYKVINRMKDMNSRILI